MTHSSRGKYRGTPGTLTVGGGSLMFTRMDGIISKKERVVVTMPTHAIVSVNVEGLVGKKLVVLVDGVKVPGIPRHEFHVPDPHKWREAIHREMSSTGQVKPPHREVAKQVYVKEITPRNCESSVQIL
ncbi:MAG: hypothetical protein ACE5IO_10355 [Thermoplasmata archaeon]